MAQGGLGARLLALAVACLLGLALVEGGLRIAFAGATNERALRSRLEASRRAAFGDGGERTGVFGLVEASVHRGVVYEVKPNLDGTFRGQPMATNRYGMRQDLEVSLPKPEGVSRVVGLGDSHMFGWGVGQSETYLARLQQLLAGAPGGRKVEVLNCAAPGYNTATEVAVFEHKCAAFEPDLVVLHFVGNDFELPHFLQPLGDAGDHGVRAPRSLLVWLVRALWRGEDAGDGVPELLSRDRRELADPEVFRRSREHYRYMAGSAGFVSALERLAASTRPRGIPVVVLMLGSGGEGRALAQAEAARHGFVVLDPSPHFAAALEAAGQPSDHREVWKAAYVIPGDGHPTPLAHQRYAEALLPVVEGLLFGG